MTEPTRLRYFREHDRPSVLGLLDVGRATEEDRALFTGADSAYEELVPVGRLREFAAHMTAHMEDGDIGDTVTMSWVQRGLLALLDELTTEGTGAR